MLKGPRKRAFEHVVIALENATPKRRLVFRSGQQRPGTLKVCYCFRYYRRLPSLCPHPRNGSGMVSLWPRPVVMCAQYVSLPYLT